MSFQNPEFVERMLQLRREKLGSRNLLPPSRDGLVGELKHPTIPGLVTGWVEITEAKAIGWLDYNVHNRKLNQGKIASFARQHMNGDFVNTHQGIAFNDANELVDGQHTLKMVILTGKPVWRMVTFGLPKVPAGKNFATMDVIDAGGRSVKDQLTISHNVKDAGLVKQICVAVASICHGAKARNLAVSEILAVYKAFEASVDWVIEKRSNEHGLKQAGVLAGFAFAHASLGAPVGKWFEELNTGNGLVDEAAYLEIRKKAKPTRPIEHLRYFLISEDSALFSKSMNRAIAGVTLQVIYGEVHKAKTQALVQSEVGTNWFIGKQKDQVHKIATLLMPIMEKKARPE